MKIKIDGEIYEVKKVHTYSSLPMLELEDGSEYYVAESSETAGEKAREYWEDLAQDDPKEFACLVGEKTLIAWGLGQSAGPGSTHTRGLNDWLDLWLNTPEEHFASYDSQERECEAVPDGEFCPAFQDPPTPCPLESEDCEDNHIHHAAGEVEAESELVEELGFAPTVAYRHN
jgi:hypothetical protein